MCHDMGMIDVMMSSSRLYEALKAEARRTNDEALIRRWNVYALELGRKLDRAAADRKRGVDAFAWFNAQSFAVRG